MKKIIFSLVALSLLIQVPVFAEETKTEETSGMLMNQAAGTTVPAMGRMGGGPPSQMVAANNGGVFVLTGSRLMKYDADLNLVKETQVKIPMGLVGDKQCPMMGKMGQAGQDTVPVPAKSQEKPV
jgi:hypothetical protein